MKKNIMIAATDSHQGKTLLSIALTAALKKRGWKISSFKTGPDYIDPMYHSIVGGRNCINLDPFFLEPVGENRSLKEQFLLYSSGTDIALIEAAMGYYSGIYGQEPRASAFTVAAALHSEVILVLDAENGVDVRLIKEYIYRYEPFLIRGIILNKADGKVYERLKPRLEKETGCEVFGFLEKREEFYIKSRHLGLYTPDEGESILSMADKAALYIEKNIDLDALLKAKGDRGLYKGRDEEEIEIKTYSESPKKEKVRIGMARDEALSFIYADNIRLLEREGVETVFFSILHDKALPEGIDGLWFPGGYPERYAAEIEKNIDMRNAVREAVEEGMPCIAECGGFLYLHRELEGEDKKIYSACGVIDSRAFRTEKLQRFGYVELRADKPCLLLDKGEGFRTHEFHYWDSETPGDACTVYKANGSKSWKAVCTSPNLFAGFPHIYFGNNIKMVKKFYNACKKYKDKKHVG